MLGLEANGITLHVQLDGPERAPAIVFANSLGTDARIWDRVTPALSQSHRLIRYDKRGHGLSEAPAGDYSIDLLVADLEALLDRLQVRDALIVGLSVGGQIAMGLAAKRPDIAKALLLCDTAARLGTDEMWRNRMAAVRERGIQSIAEDVLPRWFSADFRMSRPAELACWRAMLLRTPLAGYLGTCAALSASDLTAAARSLPQPTLCVVGAEDGASPPDLVRDTAALIPGARFREIPGVGHLPCIEAPEAVVAAIRDMLGELGYG